MLHQYFLKGHQLGEEDLSKAILVIHFSLIQAAVCFFFPIVHAVLGIHVPRLLFIGFGAMFVLILFLFRLAIIPVRTVSNIVVAIFWLGFVSASAFSGGVFSPIVACIAIVPFIASLLVDQQAAKVWAVISFTSIIVVCLAFSDASLLLEGPATPRSLTAYLAFGLIIFYFTYLFNQSKTRLFNKIKSQNEILRNQKEEINSINVQLAGKIEEVSCQNQALENHLQTLLSMAKNKTITMDSLDEALKDIVKTASQCFNVYRASIWEYKKNDGCISCRTIYLKDKDAFGVETDLYEMDLPKYFEALRRENVIPASHANAHPDTSEFRETYLKSRNIFSMLDTPFFLNGELAGVLCLEQVGELKIWKPDDIIFAQALSAVTALAYQASERRTYLKAIEQLNQSLEQRVVERTDELTKRNKQLEDFAFINAHRFRGPVCSLLGLIQLAELKDPQLSESNLIQQLRVISLDLDLITKEINDTLNEDGYYVTPQRIVKFK